jgi:hypothetical protein
MRGDELGVGWAEVWFYLRDGALGVEAWGWIVGQSGRF